MVLSLRNFTASSLTEKQNQNQTAPKTSVPNYYHADPTNPQPTPETSVSVDCHEPLSKRLFLAHPHYAVCGTPKPVPKEHDELADLKRQNEILLQKIQNYGNQKDVLAKQLEIAETQDKLHQMALGGYQQILLIL